MTDGIILFASLYDHRSSLVIVQTAAFLCLFWVQFLVLFNLLCYGAPLMQPMSESDATFSSKIIRTSLNLFRGMQTGLDAACRLIGLAEDTGFGF